MRTAHLTCHRNHQMSALIGSSSEQVWTSLWSWPPDVTASGWGGSVCKQVWTGLQSWSPDVTSRVQGLGQGIPVWWGGSLCGGVQCIMGSSHMGPPVDRPHWNHYLHATSLAGGNYSTVSCVVFPEINRRTLRETWWCVKLNALKPKTLSKHPQEVSYSKREKRFHSGLQCGDDTIV